ncbi:MAG TPA: RDD family protein [Phycicoccus sp.]|nr:RDD family protein [Phycicoccus sp.]HQH08859.1 RDD family protein [Phycicoccus sp.]HQK31419.1 RDD family protein [Phycicoccus sp.]HQY97257.1 RDD family protein [Phycicoccus sp.]
MATPDLPERPGWYDDPEHAEQLRYFDGILWTKNVTPRRTRWEAPAAGNVVGGDVSGTSRGADTWVSPPSPPPPPATSPCPANPYASAPTPTGATAYQSGPSTPDGVPMASYGLRAAAYIIDNIIVGFLSLIAGGWFLWQAIAPIWSQVMAAARANDPSAVDAAVLGMDTRQLMYYSVASVVVAIIYNLIFLTRWSATPGKLLLGISVRRLDQGGVLDLGTASRRVAFEGGLSALGNLPVIGFLALGARVADLLWPLRDPQRQTLHDKFAGTVVVQGKQVRRAQSELR